MKRLFIAGLLAASAGVAAQGHGPIEFGGAKKPMDAITLTGVKVITITIKNTNVDATAFSITVDGKIFKTTKKLPTGMYYNFDVPVELDKPNTPEVHQVCSTNIVDGDSTAKFALKMCTKAMLYWLKEDEK